MTSALRSANVTSGRYLIDLMRQRAERGGEDQQRYDLAFDVFIKQQSYSLLNKTFFWLSLASTASVALWPILVQFPPLAHGLAFVGQSIVQTMLTGFAAFNIYVYQYYKKRQTSAENLLRLIAFTTQPIDRLVDTVVDEMERLDQGIGFRAKAETPDEPDGRRNGLP